MILYLISILFYIGTPASISSWQELNVTDSIEIDKSGNYKMDAIQLHVVWNDSLYQTHKGYYGGIKTAVIFLDGRQIQLIENIKDNLGLGTVLFEYYDFNLDGLIDFRVIRSCGGSCYFDYYIFNPNNKLFKHVEEWDFIRIKEVDVALRQIKTEAEGIDSKSKVFQITGNNQLIDYE